MITFLTGGARSGKSKMAVEMGAALPGPVRLIATARGEDEEMQARIERHRRQRPESWEVVEEPVDLSEALRSARGEQTVIVDCLTLWISNLMVAHDDDVIFEMVEAAATVAADRAGATIVVSNEVGSGLVPMDPVGRRFRDLQGWANQRFATLANEAILMVSGRAIRLP